MDRQPDRTLTDQLAAARDRHYLLTRAIRTHVRTCGDCNAASWGFGIHCIEFGALADALQTAATDEQQLARRKMSWRLRYV